VLQTCLLSAFVLSPTYELFKSLELCCKDMVEWPSVFPVSPGKGVDPQKYAQLFEAVNLLRVVPKYRPTPAGWQRLRPILVKRFEEVSGCFETAERKYMRTVARSSVRPTKSCVAKSSSSAAKCRRKNSTESKHTRPSVTIPDLSMSVTGDDSGNINMRDEGKQTKMNAAQSTVTVESAGLSVDDVRKADSAEVEDDAASDITIDIDNDEFTSFQLMMLKRKPVKMLLRK